MFSDVAESKPEDLFLMYDIVIFEIMTTIEKKIYYKKEMLKILHKGQK